MIAAINGKVIGFPKKVPNMDANTFALNKYAKKFKKNKEAEKIFVKEGGWRKDDLLIQKDLGKSLSLIAKKGSKAFYDGDITKKILNDFKDNGGIFIKEDFLSYEIRKLEPLCGTYKSVSYTHLTLPTNC